jgi:Arc/MetJ-type ribon-helix-helix transcriptional regulator
MICHTAMPKTKVALTIDSTLLDRIDALVKRTRFRNRSQAIETAVAEKLARLERTRLAEECAKLNPAEEQGLADQPFGADTAWPEY